jgi:C4-dicarboxylate-specific signal transduction histidine kinase
VIQEGNRASEIIRRVRTLAKKTAPQKEALAVNGVILEVIELVSSQVTKAGVVLQTEMMTDLPTILADRVQLQQVILNLVMNGIDAMSSVTGRPKRLVIASNTAEDNGVLISIHDSGMGFGSEPPERFFEAFFTTKQKGLGLGLSISRTIVAAHGGHLWATPNPDHGATFQFSLPLAAGAAA